MTQVSEPTRGASGIGSGCKLVRRTRALRPRCELGFAPTGGVGFKVSCSHVRCEVSCRASDPPRRMQTGRTLHPPSTHRRRHLLLSPTHLRDRCLDCCRDGCNCLLWNVRLNLDRHRAARVVEVAALRRLRVPCLRGSIWTSGKIVRRRCTIAAPCGAGDHHARGSSVCTDQRLPEFFFSGQGGKNARSKRIASNIAGFWQRQSAVPSWARKSLSLST